MLLPHHAHPKGWYQDAHLRAQQMIAWLERLNFMMLNRFATFLPSGLVLGWTLMFSLEIIKP